ncbi:MAG: hypothetical protein Q8P41_24410 [Pseudomonadota bacterium]|nr:hypothetical protein [Pseudomonadota bacterium]
MLLALLLACTTDVSVTKDPDAISAQDRLGLTDAEVARILEFLNDCGTTFDFLDDDVGLDSDAAEALASHRDGPDGACATEDDAPYATLDDVDAVPQVGDQTILAILAWLTDGEVDPGGTWEGIDFTEDEIAVVLAISNDATQDQLDADVGLDVDAAANIIGERPIDDMDELAAVPEVGPSALQKLLDHVPVWAG